MAVMVPNESLRREVWLVVGCFECYRLQIVFECVPGEGELTPYIWGSNVVLRIN